MIQLLVEGGPVQWKGEQIHEVGGETISTTRTAGDRITNAAPLHLKETSQTSWDISVETSANFFIHAFKYEEPLHVYNHKLSRGLSKNL